MSHNTNTRHAGTHTDPGDGRHDRHGEDNPAVEAGMSRDLINIPDNVLQDAIRAYPQEAQDALQWAFTYGRQELDGSRSELCEKLDVDWTTLWRVAMGKYGAGIDGVIQKILDLQRRVRESGQAGFVQTLVSRKIFETLDYALAGDVNGGKIVMISGGTRRGKTEIVRQWARLNNHGRSVYIDCPAAGGLRALVQEIAEATGVNKSRRTADLLERVINSFNRRRIIIIDECLRLLPNRRSDRRPVELEFLRRLHDVKRCAVALIATPTFEHEMESGWLRAYLEQLVGRIADPLVIPEKVMQAEIREICRAYNPAPDQPFLTLAHHIANEPGKLGVLFELLGQCAAVGKRRGEPVTHAALSAAYKRRKGRTQWPEEK